MSETIPIKAKLNYRKAGVDLGAGERMVQTIAPALAGTHRSGVLDNPGGFAGFFDLKQTGLHDPILVAATDGVGTKLRLARKAGHLQGLGQDLVAMCVNDLAVYGAKPLFFLDYYACGTLDQHEAAALVGHIAHACQQVGCALLGGETAEMPGLYLDGDFDLAGFAVGAVERDEKLHKDTVRAGDQLIGLASSGLHANGFSLVRAILAETDTALDAPAPFDGSQTLAQALLTPTMLYHDAIALMMQAGGMRIAAHITGGGLAGNLVRVLPDGLEAKIDSKSWEIPPLFRWLQKAGTIEDSELRAVLNCGLGMVAVVEPNRLEPLLQCLDQNKVAAVHLGEISPASQPDAPASVRLI